MIERLLVRAKRHSKLLRLLTVLFSFVPALSWAVVIEDVSYNSLSSGKMKITLQMNSPAPTPLSFEINSPARIAFDFKGVTSSVPKKQLINQGALESLNVATHKDRTRVVLNLTNKVKYTTSQSGNTFNIFLTAGSSNGFASSTASVKGVVGSVQSKVKSVDFRRGAQGEGRLIVGLNDRNAPVNVYRKGSKLYAEFIGVDLSKDFAHRLDVLDFASPAKYVDVSKTNKGVLFVVTPTSNDYEHIAYQSDDVFTLELKPITEAEKAKNTKDRFGFTGERLSLNFQDIETRTVLQLISDFTGTNVVVSDSVGGTLTLRLKDVPWDQALDIILKTKGLSKRESGNVMLIAPAEELASQEKIALEAQKQEEKLSPLKSEFIKINYAKAEDIAGIIGSFSSGANIDKEKQSQGMLSPRGSFTVDPRTNTILINDTSETIDKVRKVIARLDVPVQQVLIESRIVIASEDFNKSLGAKFGVTGISGNKQNVISPNVSQGVKAINGKIENALNFDGGVGGGQIGLSIAKLPNNSLLSLELSALQAEGNGEIISTPRVITSDKKEASIKQGVQVPYLEASASGAATVSFKDAVLGLNVTPQITPDENIILDLNVSQDTIGIILNDTPSIDTRSVKTQVLAGNGETIVLGGIFVDETKNSVTKVPFFGDLPGLGKLFRKTVKSNQKREILIFVTPKIIKTAASK